MAQDMTVPAALCRGLFAGYGVEDIAHREKLDVRELRAEMRRAKAEGRMEWIMSHRRKRHRADLRKRSVRVYR